MDLVLENTADVVIQYAPDGTVLWASPSLETELGWNPDDVTGTKFRMSAPEDRETTSAPYVVARKEHRGEGRSLARIECADGSPRWMDVRCRFVWRHDGSLNFAVASMRNVTSEIEARRDLEASERRFRTLAENASDVVYETDATGVLLWVSPSMQPVLGWSPVDLIGMPVSGLFDEGHPGISTVDRVRLSGGTPIGPSDVLFRRYEGAPRWMSVSAMPIRGETGEIVSAIWSLRDADDFVRARESAEADQFNQRRLRATLDSLLDPHALVEAVRDETGRIVDFVFVDANEAACLQNGMSRSQLIGSRLLDLFPGQGPSGLAAMYARVIETGEPLVLDDYSYSNEILQPERRYDLRAVRVDDYLGFTWRDVTDRHQATESLAASERRYRLLAENASDVVIEVAPDNTYRWASSSVREVLGWEPDELIGGTLVEFVHPDDLGRILRARETTVDRVSKIAAFRFRRADGSYLWVSGRAREVVDADGNTSGRVVSLRDDNVAVLARQALAESEARYRLLAENASDVVYQTDDDGMLQWVSPSIERILGWRAADLVGTRATDLIAPEDLPQAEAERARVYHGERIRHFECRFRTVTGELRWMEIHAQPIYDDAGGLIAAVVGLQDIQSKVVMRRALATLSAGNAVLARSEHEAALLYDMCETAVQEGGYLFSWYGQPLGDARRTVAKVASSVAHRDYLESIEVSWGEGPLAQGPFGVALRAGRTTVTNELTGQTAFAPWADEAVSHGFGSEICLPVFVNGTIDGVLAVYAAEQDAFDRRSTAVLEELASQIGVGLGRIRNSEALAKTLADWTLLHTAIEQAVEAIVVTDTTPAILYANPATVRSSGRTLDEVLGQNPRIFQSGLQSGEFYRSMWSRLAGGQSWHGTLVNRRKDGELYEEDTTVTPVHEVDGSLIAYVAVKHDVTHERRLQADLTRQQDDQDIVVKAMKAVRVASTLEGTVATFCQEVTHLEGIDVARVLVLDPTGEAISLGQSDPPILDWVDNVPIVVEQRDQFIAKTNGGPWWFDLSDRTGIAGLNPAMTAAASKAGLEAAALAPMRWEGRMVGILLVASRNEGTTVWTEARLRVLEELGSFAGSLIGAKVEERARRERQRSLSMEIIDQKRFRPVFQPVVDLTSHQVRGYEALTRFEDGLAPDQHFSDARAVGLGSELESAAVAAAIEVARRLPPEAWLSVNFSPAAVIDGHAAETIARSDRPIVIEITEHEQIESYPALRRAIEGCGSVRLSVDDAGAGYASLRHIAELRPDFVKLDIGLVRNIDADPARQALAAGLCHFAAETGTTLIAEGIETEVELDTVRRLGVHLGQGFLLGRPEYLA